MPTMCTQTPGDSPVQSPHGLDVLRRCGRIPASFAAEQTRGAFDRPRIARHVAIVADILLVLVIVTVFHKRHTQSTPCGLVPGRRRRRRGDRLS